MSSSTVAEVVCALADPHGEVDLTGVALEGAAADELVESVLHHRLQGALVDAARRADRPVDERITGPADDDRLERLRAQRALPVIAEALDDAAVPWLVFKGPVVARLLARPEVRTFNDLDVLVARQRFGDAIAALTAVGAQELNRNWTPYVRYLVGEVPMELGPVPIDLHWHVTALRHTRRGVDFDPAAMLQRRRVVEVAGRALPTFDPEDQLLHLAVHAGLGGANRLDQLRDLSVAVTDDVDWPTFVERARAAAVSGLVGHTLDRAAIAAGAPVDDHVLHTLAGVGSLRRRRRFDGDVVAMRRVGVHWRRDDPRAAVRAAWRSVYARVPARLGGPGGWDFTDPGGTLFHDRASGGESARRRFVELVERGTTG